MTEAKNDFYDFPKAWIGYVDDIFAVFGTNGYKFVNCLNDDSNSKFDMSRQNSNGCSPMGIDKIIRKKQFRLKLKVP